MVETGIDELKNRLGTELKSITYAVEPGLVQRFVQAVGDTNPMWQGNAPPTFVLVIGFEQILNQMLALFPSQTLLHGSSEMECYQPVTLGDILTASVKITNVRERQGKMGKTVFIVFDISYTNQRQETVASCRQTVISY